MVCIESIYMENQDVKLQRAAARATKLHKKRVEYDRSASISHRAVQVDQQLSRQNSSRVRASSLSGPIGRDACKPHRSARCAARTCLASASVESCVDLPTVHMGREGRWVRWRRKPAVTPMLRTAASPILKPSEGPHCYDIEALDEAETSAGEAWDAVDPYADSQRSPWLFSFSLPIRRSIKHAPQDASAIEDVSEGVSLVPEEGLNSSAVVETQPQKSEEGIQDTSPFSLSSKHSSGDKNSGASDAGQVMSPERKPCADLEKRKAIMTSVLAAQRKMHEIETKQLQEASRRAVEAEEVAAAAKLKAEELEKLLQKERATKPVDLKKLERLHAAEMKRKRNQEARIRMLREKADLALQQAQRMRDDTEAEGIALKARLLAEAQAEAEAHRKSELVRARSEAEALVRTGAEEVNVAKARMVEQLQAEYEIAKQQADQELTLLKTQAQAHTAECERLEEEARIAKETVQREALEFKATIEAEVNAYRVAEAQASLERARSLRDESLQEALAIRAKAEEDARAQEGMARKTSQVAKREAKRLEQEKTKMEQQQASEGRRLRQQHEQQLEATRAAAVERSQALQEAAAIKAKAQVIQRQMVAEARLKAEEEADRLRKKALAEAEEIKAAAQAEARAVLAREAAMLEQARRETHIQAIEHSEESRPRKVPRMMEKDSLLETTESDWTLCNELYEEDDAWAVLV